MVTPTEDAPPLETYTPPPWLVAVLLEIVVLWMPMVLVPMGRIWIPPPVAARVRPAVFPEMRELEMATLSVVPRIETPPPPGVDVAVEEMAHLLFVMVQLVMVSAVCAVPSATPPVSKLSPPPTL